MRRALLLLAGTAAACSSTAPQSRLYHFSTVPIAAASPLGAVSIGVGPLTPAAHLLEQRIAARVSDVELEYYAGHRWAAPLSDLLPEAVLQGLADAGMFREVVRGGESAGRADVILSGVVLAFEEEDRAEGWFGVARLDLVLRAARTDRILWSGRAHGERRASARNPVHVVEALRGALGDALASVPWREALAPPPPSSPSPPPG